MEQDLLRIFRDFGTPRQRHNPVYPLWYLRTDGVWEVPEGEAALVREGKSSEPTKTWLRENHIAGGLTPDPYDAVRSNPAFLAWHRSQVFREPGLEV